VGAGWCGCLAMGVIICSKFLGTIASPEMIKVTEPHKVYIVPEADEDDRKLIKFAVKRIPYYNPRAGYAYYEFTGRKYIIPDRNIMVLNKVFVINIMVLSVFLFLIVVGIIILIRKEIYSLDLVFATSLALMGAMMKLKRYRHQLCPIQSGNAYSFKGKRLMEEYWNQIQSFSIASMITVLKFINRRYKEI
jgi:hypothetical protein